MVYLLVLQPQIRQDFSLIDQIKRASMSVVANIAEGYGRQTVKDKQHFLTMALGSANEVMAHLDIVTAIYNLDTTKLRDYYDHLGKQLYLLRKSIR